MKTVFSSQDGKQIIFLPCSRGYLYKAYVRIVWKSVFLFKSLSHRWAQTTGAPELHLPQISKVKFSQQNKQKSGAASSVLQLLGKLLYSAVPKAKYYFLNVNRTPVDRQEAMLYKNRNK